eukprot:1191159-Pyramimonas_sp.AAC.1
MRTPAIDDKRARQTSKGLEKKKTIQFAGRNQQPARGGRDPGSQGGRKIRAWSRCNHLSDSSAVKTRRHTGDKTPCSEPSTTGRPRAKSRDPPLGCDGC